jgi:predicted transposase YbfD/YdcC
MLASMKIENAVITADAMHCQTETSQLIREGKGDYVLQVKNNQASYLKKLRHIFISLNVISLRHYNVIFLRN